MEGASSQIAEPSSWLLIPEGCKKLHLCFRLRKQKTRCQPMWFVREKVGTEGRKPQAGPLKNSLGALPFNAAYHHCDGHDYNRYDCQHAASCLAQDTPISSPRRSFSQETPAPVAMPTITETTGDIFTAPPHSILIHACNARGSWGAGVALAFKTRYPAAYKLYHTHCNTPPPGTSISAHQASLPGTCLLIPPYEAKGKAEHWIACLFTSLGYGRGVSKEAVILENTRGAVRDLGEQVQGCRGRGETVGECRAVRINSGKFGVRWEKTKGVLEEGGVDIRVVRPVEEAEKEVAKEGKAGSAKRVSDDVAGDKKRIKGAGGGVGKGSRQGGLDGWLN